MMRRAVLVRAAYAAVLAVVSIFACRTEPPRSAIAVALERGEPQAWPLPLSPLRSARDACRSNFCLAGDALDLVLNRAAHWMASYDKELRFDAAIGLSQLRRTVDSVELERAWAAAATVADADTDHPHRRFWHPDLRSPAAHTSQWQPPRGEGRANLNDVISEALHCRENGWRAQTTEYVCGPMRDNGGYESTHALWALALARGGDCLDAAALQCLRAIQNEIATAQPASLEPQRTLDIDLYAERLLTLLLSQYDEPEVHTWARNLIALQGSDGSWGMPAKEDPYYRYHATNAASWALAEWLRFLAASRGLAATLGAFRVEAPLPIGGAAFWGCALPQHAQPKFDPASPAPNSP